MGPLRRFMEGRYGLDNLSFALTATALALGLLSYLPHLYVLRYAQYLLFAVIVWRTLSRNTERRYRANMTFLSLWGRVRMWFQRGGYGRKRFSRSAKESSAHKLYSCPHCAKTLRVPRGKGDVMITCPVCQERFRAKT